jgi:hypothetical protein
MISRMRAAAWLGGAALMLVAGCGAPKPFQVNVVRSEPSLPAVGLHIIQTTDATFSEWSMKPAPEALFSTAPIERSAFWSKVINDRSFTDATQAIPVAIPQGAPKQDPVTGFVVFAGYPRNQVEADPDRFRAAYSSTNPLYEKCREFRLVLGRNGIELRTDDDEPVVQGTPGS